MREEEEEDFFRYSGGVGVPMPHRSRYGDYTGKYVCNSSTM